MAGLQIPVETKGAQRNLKGLAKGFDKVGDEAKKSEVQVKGFKKVLGTTRGTLSKLIGSFTGLKAAIIGAMGSLALGAMAKSFLKAKTTSEGFNTRLTVLLGSVEHGAEVFKRMSEFAGRVPFSFEEIMESATTLAGVLKGGVDEIEQFMPLIGDLAAATGLSIQDTTGQIIRMLSAGASAADLFRERGVLAMLGFQAGVRVSVEDTRKRLIEAWEDPVSKFRGATDALAKTWDGLMSMVGDKWFEFRNLVMDAGVFDFIKINLTSVVEGLQKMKDTGDLKVWAQNLADGVITAFEVIAKGIGIAIDAFNGLRMTWGGLKSAWHLTNFAILSGIESLMNALTMLFDGLDMRMEKVGKTLVTVGKFTGKPILEMIGTTLASGNTLTETFKGMADEAGRLADESERALIAESDKVVALANQGSAYGKISRWTEDMRIKLKKLQEDREAVKEGGFVQPTLVQEVKEDPDLLKKRASDLKEWNRIAVEVGKSRYQIESEALDENYERYKKVAEDKVLVDEWYALQRAEILQRESDRSIAEFEEEISAMEDGYTSLLDDIVALGDVIDNQFADGLSNAFTDFVTGSKSAKAAFTDFSVSFVKDIIGMIAKQAILNALQSAGGIWGGLVSGIAGAASGAGGGGAPRANGGSVSKGRSYTVGEKGPETFVPNETGKIVPNKDKEGAGGDSINIINVTDKSMIDEYMYSDSGEKAILNVLSANADKVKRVLR